jgi:hypothetical protein
MSLFLNLNQYEDQLLEEQVNLFNVENFTNLSKQKFLIKLLKEHAVRTAIKSIRKDTRFMNLGKAPS